MSAPSAARRRRPAASLIAATVALVTVLATGCAPGGEDAGDPRPVTAEESELLAAMRFRNFDAGTRAVSFAVDDAGAELSFQGWFDFASGVGYGALAEGGTPNSLLLWNDAVVGVHPPVAGADGAAGFDRAPLPIPDVDALDTAWSGGPVDPSASRLHAVLAVIAALGVDRPDNPLLLRQGGALWLGEERVGGTEATVFAGPLSSGPLPSGQTLDADAATTRYWVDAAGVLHRAAVRLGGAGAWTTIELSDADGVTLGDPFSAAEAMP